jgi:broad specificity phosphatase PhoE
MIFVVRHGERADFAGAEDKKLITLEFDPPLTALGCRQAEVTGKEVSRLLKQANFKPRRFIFVTSPYLRCVQTSIHMAEGLEGGEIFENTLFLQDPLGEFFHRTWFDRNVLSELFVRKRPEEFLKLCPLYEKRKIKESFIEEADLLQPKYPEDFNDYYKRVDFCFRNIRDYYFEKFDPKQDVLIIVSHGYAIQVVLENFGALQKLNAVEYCCINQFYYEDVNRDRDQPKQLVVCGNDHIAGKL